MRNTTMKKRVVKTFVATSLMGALGLAPLPSVAGGFPVVDIPALIKQVQQISDEVERYQELIKQTGLDTQQLTQMIHTYDQLVQRYKLAMAQAASLKDKMSERDWQALLAAADSAFKYAPESGNDIQSNHDAETGQAITEHDRLYGSLDPRSKLKKDSIDVLGEMPSGFEQDYANATRSIEQQKQYKRFLQQQEGNSKSAEGLDAKRGTLGDQSELATLQTIVDQNQLVINQLSTMNETLQAQYHDSNQLANIHNNAVAIAHQEWLKQVKQRQQTPPNLNHPAFTLGD